MQPPSPALPNSREYTLSLLIWEMDPGRSIKLTEIQEEAGAGRGGDSLEFNPHSSGPQRLLSLLSSPPPYGVFVVTGRETSFQLYQEPSGWPMEENMSAFPARDYILPLKIVEGLLMASGPSFWCGL